MSGSYVSAGACMACGGTVPPAPDVMVHVLYCGGGIVVSSGEEEVGCSPAAVQGLSRRWGGG